MSYRPVLTVRAAAQFADLSRQQEVYEAFMDRLLILVGAPWDAWLVQPGGGEPEFRETHFPIPSVLITMLCAGCLPARDAGKGKGAARCR